MKYITLIYDYDGEMANLSELENEVLLQQHRKLQQLSISENAYLSACELKSAKTAVSVRNRNNKVLITDGPYVESKELFVGFYVFECVDLDSALRWAKMIPTYQNGGVEVRPIDEGSNSVGNAIESSDFNLNSESRLYALLIYRPENPTEFRTDRAKQQSVAGHDSVVYKAKSSGVYVIGTQLKPAHTATAIRKLKQETRVTDGPISKTTNVLLGQHILACNTIGDAIAYAELIVEENIGVIEVRPINYYEQSGNELIQWHSKTSQ